MPTFTAIDFETATRRPDSACAVGLVRVEDGRIVRRISQLIQPWSRRFEFTWLHGISWEDVQRAPRFDGVASVIRELCRDVDFVAAHNAAFDRQVLRACFSRAGITAPRVRFECTVRLARRTWGIRPTRLDVVARTLGIPLRHHDALSDAEACARIVLASSEARRRKGRVDPG